MEAKRSWRKLKPLWALSCCLTLAGPACTAPPRAVEDTVERSDWRPAAGIHGFRLQTPHYEILCTAQDETLREYVPRFMEACHRQYGEWIPLPAPQPRRTRIYLFDTRQQWAAFTQQFVPHHAHLYLHLQAGGYMDHASATIVVYDVGRDRTLALLAHEGLHQYITANITSRIPAWLNEGLATQFEAFDLEGATPVFRPQNNLFRKNSLREALVSDGAWIPLRTLLVMDAGDAVRQAGQATRGYYAQIWALLLFLREDPQGRYSAGMERMLRDLGSTHRPNTRDGPTLFQQYITDDLDACEAHYRAFASTLVQ